MHLSLFSSVLALAAMPALAATPAKSTKVIEGNFDMVVCASSPRIKVRMENLETTLFVAPNHASLKVFQGWGSVRKTINVEGKPTKFMKVQFARLPGRDGLDMSG